MKDAQQAQKIKITLIIEGECLNSASHNKSQLYQNGTLLLLKNISALSVKNLQKNQFLLISYYLENYMSTHKKNMNYELMLAKLSSKY